MKIINRKNVIPIICISYTVVSIIASFFEGVIYGGLNHTQLNLISMLFLCSLSILILSQHYRLECFPVWVIIVIQYVVGVLIVFVAIFVSGFFADLSSNAYRDMFLSFSIPYVVAVIIYYLNLKAMIKNQNNDLRKIKEKYPNR